MDFHSSKHKAITTSSSNDPSTKNTIPTNTTTTTTTKTSSPLPLPSISSLITSYLIMLVGPIFMSKQNGVSSVSGSHKQWLLVATLTLLFQLLTFVPFTDGEKTTTVTAGSSSCSYTIVIDEFDASKCVGGAQAQHLQADGVGLSRQRAATPYLKMSAAGKADNRQQRERGYQQENNYHRRNYRGGKPQPSAASSDSKFSDSDTGAINGGHGGGGDAENTRQNNRQQKQHQLQDVESKLIEEMIRNREINSTLQRHNVQLNAAQHTLEAYRANFSSVFRTMMKMERRLRHQQRINRSLNKKLSNVILDVVEVNNQLSTKIVAAATSGSRSKPAKKFRVESAGKLNSCPGFSDTSKVFKGTWQAM